MDDKDEYETKFDKISEKDFFSQTFVEFQYEEDSRKKFYGDIRRLDPEQINDVLYEHVPEVNIEKTEQHECIDYISDETNLYM